MAKHDTLLINEVSRISQATQVRGSLVSQSDIRIDGTFEGDLITAGKLVLGENATIVGNVMCGNADIWGKIEGPLPLSPLTFSSSQPPASPLLGLPAAPWSVCLPPGA